MARKNASAAAERLVREGSIKPVEHASVYELVVVQLRRAMHNGTYAPGDKFPTERELADRLRVSRASVREAVRVLEGEGYVETRRGSTGGIVVLDRTAEEGRIGPYIREMLPRIREVFEFRKAVEREAARLAARRRTDEDVTRLEAAHSVIESDQETRRFRSADSQFHLGIAEAAGNRWMRDAIDAARTEVWMPADTHYDHVLDRHTRDEHGKILEAIRNQDEEAAARLMDEHLASTLEVLELVAQVGEAPPAGRRRSTPKKARKRS
jgi:GntR family transcriptional regulator, transcriptional repressor for pyruvate dehydrogenase complex